MRKNFFKTHLGIVFLFLLSLSFVSCHHDEDDTAIKEGKWASTVFDAMKQIYLWNDVLPSSLNTKKYTTPQNTLDYLKGIKINPENGEQIDRYSFLDKIGNLSGEITGGTSSGDYGFMVTAAYSSFNQVSFFVTYVYKNSPAGLAGVARSYEITQINGSSEVHPLVGSDGYLTTTSAGYVNMTNALFKSTSASFTFKRTDGTKKDVSLKAASYTINSIICDSIYNVGTQKVGYMVFNQFLGKTAQTEISNVISKFESNNVKNIIIDLRYNGGGSVETCEYFCNQLTPQTANGKLMYRYKMNTLLTNYYEQQKKPLFANFAKTNSFQPTKIYFIVGGGTASASELLINNLRPYFSGNLYLIGNTTYGKPCGFWATPIGYEEDQTTTKEGYDLYAVSMETVNANNEGGYYAGMTPGTSQYPGVKANDSFKFTWGDIQDGCLSQALYHVLANSFKATTSAPAQIKSVSSKSLSGIDRQFKGMIDFRRHLNP